MSILTVTAWVFAGCFLVNAIPHGVQGLSGRALQTPFAKPPGVGLSTSRTNVVWAAINVAVGWTLLFQVGEFDVRDVAHVGVVFAGVFGVFVAGRFGRHHGGNVV